MIQYPLANSSWDEKEINSAIEVIKSGYCSMGKIVKQFEEKFAHRFGSKYAVMSNSGSSANLLAISALMYKKKNPLRPGDEVIVPAVSWSTTFSPLHQNNLKMVFVDINLETLNIDVDLIEKAITKKTRAIFAVHLLGNPCDIDRLQKICKKHKLILIEDTCESMGATYKNKQCGTFGLLGTFSCFYSHHISTIEGGVTVTDNEELYQIMLSLRAHGWIRELPLKNHICNKSGIPFEDSFKFALPGYNLRPNEIYAAIGLHQLDKLPDLLEQRRKNYDYFYKKFVVSKLPIKIQKHCGQSSVFGFSMILEPNQQQIVAKTLLENGIECRPIVAGNMTKNPVMKHMKHRISGKMKCATLVDGAGLFVGNSHLDLTQEIDHLFQVLKSVLK
jgi:CDP-6-deoxy-D-xylo-4-hexulose-3-dehydrase